MASGEFFKILWTDTGSVKLSFVKCNAAFSAKKLNSNLYRILSLSQSELRSYYRTLYSDFFPDLRFRIFISYALSIIKNISGKESAYQTSYLNSSEVNFTRGHSSGQDQS